MTPKTGNREEVVMGGRKEKPSEIGIKIKILMLQKGLTGRELATRIHKAPSTVSDVISGKNRSAETIEKIMAELFA